MGFPLPSLSPSSPSPLSGPASPEPPGMRWRKLIHVGSGLLLAGWWVGGFPLFRTLIWLAFAVAVLVEIARKTPRGGMWFRTLLGSMLKPREYQGDLTDAFWHLLACTVLVTLFPPSAALAGFLLLVFADPAAFAVGRRGRWPLPGTGKTVEGSLAFLLTAGGLLSLIPGASPTQVILTAVGGGLVELFTRRDNLWVPLTGAILWSLSGTGSM